MILVGEAAVRGGDHLLAGLEPAQHLDEIAVAPAELDLALGGAVAALVDDEDPVAAGVVEECAVRDQQRPRRIADGQLGLDRLAALHRLRLGPDEEKVDLELPVADLRIDLRDLKAVGLAVDVGGRRLPDGYPTEIIFIDVGLELVAAGAVDLADALALLQRLAELDVEAAQLAGDRCPDVELAKAALRDPHAAVERRGSQAQLLQLAPLQRLVLVDALLEDRETIGLVGEIVLRVVEGLHRDEALLGKRLLKVVLPPRLGEIVLGLVQVAKVRVVGVDERQLLAPHVVELLLDLRLFLERGELQFGVREDGEKLALRNLRAVLDQLLLDLSPLDRIEIDGEERGHARTHWQEVVEGARLRFRDRQAVLSDGHRIRARCKQPEDQYEQEHRRNGAADHDSAVEALADDDPVHGAAADGVRLAGLAQLDKAHCPPPNSFCPETDEARRAIALSLSSTLILQSPLMALIAGRPVPIGPHEFPGAHCSFPDSRATYVAWQRRSI